ncbi:MAG: tryptophan 2,3-dioxygenase family protein [Anaerolineales bacterium]
MFEPARWKDDPPCGHQVAHPYQTHYCSHIRVPKLLTLQHPRTPHPDEILALLILQAIELWLRVILNDVKSALRGLASDQPPVYQPTKLLHRAARLIRLLDLHTDLAESVLLHDLGLLLPLSGPLDDIRSAQLRELESVTGQLAQLELASGPSRIESVHGLAGRFTRWSERYQRLLADLFERDRPQAPSFDEYLKLDELLKLQVGAMGDWAAAGERPTRLLAPEQLSPDELMFIVVHQVFELWFRALLHELDQVLAELGAPEPAISEAARRMRRVVRIQELLAEMIQIPATIAAMDFLRFRQIAKRVEGVVHERGLSPASGTESYQFRELEVIAGLKHSVAYEEFLAGNPDFHTRFLTPGLKARLSQPSLPEAFHSVLAKRGLDAVIEIFKPADVANPHADLAELADLLLEFDHFFQLWRFNHLTMVQSMIGRKSGTGFLGPEYLKETVGLGMQGEDDRLLRTPQIRPRFFEDLWEARTRMQVGEQE